MGYCRLPAPSVTPSAPTVVVAAGRREANRSRRRACSSVESLISARSSRRRCPRAAASRSPAARVGWDDRQASPSEPPGGRTVVVGDGVVGGGSGGGRGRSGGCCRGCRRRIRRCSGAGRWLRAWGTRWRRGSRQRCRRSGRRPIGRHGHRFVQRSRGVTDRGSGGRRRLDDRGYRPWSPWRGAHACPTARDGFRSPRRDQLCGQSLGGRDDHHHVVDGLDLSDRDGLGRCAPRGLPSRRIRGATPRPPRRS